MYLELRYIMQLSTEYSWLGILPHIHFLYYSKLVRRKYGNTGKYGKIWGNKLFFHFLQFGAFFGIIVNNIKKLRILRCRAYIVLYYTRPILSELDEITNGMSTATTEGTASS